MTDLVSILGLDTGLGHFGYAVLSFHRSESSGRLALTAAGGPVFSVITTNKSDKKRQVAATEDNIRRCRELTPPLLRLIHPSSGLNVRALIVEAMSFPRNASAVAKIGMAFGVVAILSEVFNLPVVQLSPQEVKKRLCGRQNASKEEIQSVVSLLYPMTVGVVSNGLAEHAYDALAVAHASLDTEVVRMVRQIVV